MKIHKTNGEREVMLHQMKSAMEEKIILPVGVSYKIVKNRLAIEQALSAFRALRDEIITRYSNGTGRVMETDENYEKVTVEMVQAAEQYTDVEICEIDISELGEKELPLNVVSALGFMMK